MRATIYKGLFLCVWFLALFYLFFQSVLATKGLSLTHARSEINLPLLPENAEEYVDLLTFGHRAALDGLLQVWAVQILSPNPGLEVNTQGNSLASNLRQIVQFKPAVESIYLLSCYHFLFKEKKDETCLDILAVGLQVFPNSWRLPMTQGYVYGFVRDDKVKSAAYYSLAASRSEAPKWVGELAQKLLNEEEVKPDAALATLQSVFADHTDVEARTVFSKLLLPILEKKRIARAKD